MTDRNENARIMAVAADMRRTADDWIADGFDTGDVVGTLTGYADDLGAAMKGEGPAVGPAHAVVLAITALPIGIPSLQALQGAMPSILEDQAAHYATAQALTDFLQGYGHIDKAEASSTEEGEAFAIALGMLARLDVSTAILFDAALEADIRSGMTVETALDPDERRVRQELDEMAAATPATARDDADERRVREELAELRGSPAS